MATCTLTTLPQNTIGLPNNPIKDTQVGSELGL